MSDTESPIDYDERVRLRFLTEDEYREFRSRSEDWHNERIAEYILCNDTLELMKKAELFNRSAVWEDPEAMYEVLTKSDKVRSAYIAFLRDLMGPRPGLTKEEQREFDRKRRDALDCDKDNVWRSLCYCVLDKKEPLPVAVYEVLYELGFDFFEEFVESCGKVSSETHLYRMFRDALANTGLSGSQRFEIVEKAMREYTFRGN